MNALGVQLHGGIFILRYTSLKMAVLLHKTALLNFPMATTVGGQKKVLSARIFLVAIVLESTRSLKNCYFRWENANKSVLIVMHCIVNILQ